MDRYTLGYLLTTYKKNYCDDHCIMMSIFHKLTNQLCNGALHGINPVYHCRFMKGVGQVLSNHFGWLLPSKIASKHKT